MLSAADRLSVDAVIQGGAARKRSWLRCSTAVTELGRRACACHKNSIWVLLGLCCCVCVTPLAFSQDIAPSGTNAYRRLTFAPNGFWEGLSLTPYGYLRTDLRHNWQCSDGTPSDSTVSLRYSRLGLDAFLPKVCTWFDIAGKAEVDWLSGTDAHPQPRLRHAYLKFEGKDGWSLLTGQTYDAWYIVDPAMQAYLYPCNRRPQLRLTKVTTLPDGTQLTARLAGVQNRGEKLDASHSRSNHEIKHTLMQGALIAERCLLTKRTSRISLSGSFGREHNEFTQNPEATGELDAFILMNTTSLPLHERFTLSGAVYTGENMDTYFLGRLCRGTNERQGIGIRGSGGWLQGTVYCVRNISFNYGYACVNLNESDLEPGYRSYNACHYLNSVYPIAPRVRVVAEGNYFEKEIVLADHSANFRFQMSVYLYF